jgi:uncharacterized protein (DUF1810 family)
MVSVVDDPFGLERFVAAQEPVFAAVCAELRAGRKQSHWMWFVFPQIAGLGASTMARHYAISGRAEAEAYLAHAVLGARLVECTQLVNAVAGRTAREIFGGVDELKFCSSMTLFDAVAGGGVFAAALQKYFGGMADARTIELLA